MQTKPLLSEQTAPTPTAVQDHPDETHAKTPQAFYAKMVTRPDVRAILTRLATIDQEETR